MRPPSVVVMQPAWQIRGFLLRTVVAPGVGSLTQSCPDETLSLAVGAGRIESGTFILEGVGGKPGKMQADGIHPVAVGQPRMLGNLWPTLEPLL